MTADRRDRLGLALLIPALVGLSAWLTHAAGLELHFDEAQYWEWSQRLDWSYYSKGPLVAWLIALSEGLFGHGEWQTRLPAWIIHGLWLMLLYGMARDVWGTRAAGWWAVLIGFSTPLYFALGLVMTTDILLFTCWTAGLWFMYRALFRDRPLAWYGAGLAFGAGALAKLSIALLPLSALPWILIYHRRALLNPHVWGAVGLMIVVMSPMLLWNMDHGWLMFRHELHHVEGEGRALPLEFVIGQWAVLSPIVVAVALSVLWRQPETSDRRFLWWTALIVLAFFTYKSIGAKVQLNWPAPVYIGLIVLFAGQVRRLSPRWRGTLYTGIAFSFLLMAPIFFPSAFGLPPDKDPLRIAKAWRQGVAQIQAVAPRTDFLFTHNYQIAAELAYYWPGKPLPVHIASFGQRRYNQHDLWPGLESEIGHDGLYVSTSTNLPEMFTKAFASCGDAQAVAAKNSEGKRVRTLYFRVCRDYRNNDVWLSPVGY